VRKPVVAGIDSKELWRMQVARWLSVAVALSSCAAQEASEELPQQSADIASVPLLVEGNRPFVELTLQGPSGAERKARFLVDTGGGAFLLTESVASELGLEWGEPVQEEGMSFAQVVTPLAARVDHLPLELDPQRVAVALGVESILPAAAPGSADGMLPGHVLARQHVVFDYPAALFVVARPGALLPRGEAAPMSVHERSGFPRTGIEIAGQRHGMLLDTGAAFTMVSDALLKSLGDAHPDWPRYEGAHGDARLLGGQTLETMLVPGARWEGHALTELGITSQRTGVFEEWMSAMTAEPVVGALAGNVLKDFRVELDYANETVYLSRP
jgi:predicted aspartyl protease